MVKTTPAMGWNTWNTFTSDINEELVLRSADVMVESGLKDAGYEYIVKRQIASRSRKVSARNEIRSRLYSFQRT